MTPRRLLSHLLAALAYGLTVQGCLGILLLTRYHGRMGPDGRWDVYFDILGTPWNRDAVLELLVLFCLGAPILLGVMIAIFRPIAALESKPALIAHGLTLAAAIFMNLIALFFAAMAGWNETSF